MRPRKQIETELSDALVNYPSTRNSVRQDLILEVLLDIRELLTKWKEAQWISMSLLEDYLLKLKYYE